MVGRSVRIVKFKKDESSGKEMFRVCAEQFPSGTEDIFQYDFEAFVNLPPKKTELAKGISRSINRYDPLRTL